MSLTPSVNGNALVNDLEFFRRVDSALVGYQLITRSESAEIERLNAERKLEYEQALHQCARIDLDAYKKVLEEASGCIAVDPSQITIDEEFVKSILEVLPLKAIVAHRVFPVSLGGNELTLAMPNPADEELLTELEGTTSLRIKPVVTTYRGVQQAIEKNYGPMLREVLREVRQSDRSEVLASVLEEKRREPLTSLYDRFLALINREYDRVRDDPTALSYFLVHPTVVSYVQRMLIELILLSPSDIHIEPGARSYRYRARINGVLKTYEEVPRKCGEVVTMRIKVMAGAELDEYSQPVDAQIGYSPLYGRRVEFRVSFLPTIAGNKTVLRLLEKKNQNVGLDRIGLTSAEKAIIERQIAAPDGLVLVTGPTGSGKTSTLYSILSVLNDEETCIVTAEEPVESEIPGVVQVSCSPECTFAMALRSFLRQDPDVIMVGEIRDQETADIALKAALTGHLVLSTLHTNDAPTAVMRLLNLDMDPFVVASSLRMVVAQRLIRVLCTDCRSPIGREEVEKRNGIRDLPEGTYFDAAGCIECNQTGYSGRSGVYEILEGGDAITEAINRRATLGEIRDIALQSGMKTLRQRAIELCAAGMTSPAEVIRVTAE
jgi:type IV pilus assembly protein PilB